MPLKSKSVRLDSDFCCHSFYGKCTTFQNRQTCEQGSGPDQVASEHVACERQSGGIALHQASEIITIPGT